MLDDDALHRGSEYDRGTGCGKTARPGVRPAKADAFSGSQSRQGKSQKPCSLDGREEGNRITEAHRQGHLRDDSEPSGRSVSERRSGPESGKPRRPSPHPEGEGSMSGRNLAETTRHSDGVEATARTKRKVGLLISPKGRASDFWALTFAGCGRTQANGGRTTPRG